MKKRMLIAAPLAGVFCLHCGLAWAANPPQPGKEKTQIHDQQPSPVGQPVSQQNHTGDDTKTGAAKAVNVKGPAPVIIGIRRVTKNAN